MQKPALLLAIALAFGAPAIAAEKAVKLPPPAQDVGATAPTAKAVFAGGCFWGVQAVFQHTKGVLNAVSGYSGGEGNTARYEMVGSGKTGHAEAVEVTYDPRQVSYGKLMQVFFSVAHDPTQLNRQGPDTGPQYRSAIFAVNGEQKAAAEQYIAQLNGAKVFPSRIVTEVAPLKAFYSAEGYHQDYATLNPNQPYILFNDRPKVENLKTMMPDLYRAKPVLVSDAR